MKYRTPKIIFYLILSAAALNAHSEDGPYLILLRKQADEHAERMKAANPEIRLAEAVAPRPLSAAEIRGQQKENDTARDNMEAAIANAHNKPDFALSQALLTELKNCDEASEAISLNAVRSKSSANTSENILFIPQGGNVFHPKNIDVPILWAATPKPPVLASVRNVKYGFRYKGDPWEAPFLPPFAIITTEDVKEDVPLHLLSESSSTPQKAAAVLDMDDELRTLNNRQTKIQNVVRMVPRPATPDEVKTYLRTLMRAIPTPDPSNKDLRQNLQSYQNDEFNFPPVVEKKLDSIAACLRVLHAVGLDESVYRKQKDDLKTLMAERLRQAKDPQVKLAYKNVMWRVP